MATPRDPREQLIDLGLLPNPNTYAHNLLSKSTWQPEFEDPRVHLHQKSLETLASDYERMFTAFHAANSRSNRAEHHASHRARALEWLAANYDLDDLALDVIGHALTAGSND